MNRYKLCPVCLAKNSEDEALCSSCASDISNASVKTEFAAGERPSAGGAGLRQTFKICPKCKTRNPDYAMICDNCQNDICDMPPAGPQLDNSTGNADLSAGSSPDSSPDCGTFVETNHDGPPKLILQSKTEKIIIEMTNADILGRCDRCPAPRANQSKCSVMNETRKNIDCVKYNTVSRRHAQFVFENGNFYIIPLPESKNATLLNGAELERGVKHAIKNGDRIRFSSKLELEVII